jgi:5-methylcytosine-specific restriction endonuclease McrA
VSGFRARQRKLGHTVSAPRPKELRAWLEEQPPVCTYCGGGLTQKTFSVDHALPLSRGGTNELSNLRVCCRKCNESKGAMSEPEFIELLHLAGGWEDSGTAMLARLRRGHFGYRRAG